MNWHLGTEDSLLRFERIRESISTGELERRWKATRAEMSVRGLDFLVAQNTYRYLGGYVRWLTDIPAVIYPVTVIFPIDGEMTIVAHTVPPMWATRGVRKVIFKPHMPTFNYINDIDAQATVEILKSERPSRIGILGMGTMTAASFSRLVKELPETRIDDATDVVDEIKAVKSEEEIKLILRTSDLQDLAMEIAINAVKPGRREFEIATEVRRAVLDMGSEEQWIPVGSAPAGIPALLRHPFLQNRILRDGDVFSILIEVSGVGGYYTEIHRTICIGRIPRELEIAFEDALEAEKLMADKLKEGARPRDILKVSDDFLVGKGYSPETRLCGHGQGYDLVERPGIRHEEPMNIRVGMNITLHPTALTSNAYGYINDNYLVTETGARRIHKTPQQIFCT